MPGLGQTIGKFEDQKKIAFDEQWDWLGTGLRGTVQANLEWDRAEPKQDLLMLHRMLMAAHVATGKRTRCMYTKYAYDMISKIRIYPGETRRNSRTVSMIVWHNAGVRANKWKNISPLMIFS